MGSKHKHEYVYGTQKKQVRKSECSKFDNFKKLSVFGQIFSSYDKNTYISTKLPLSNVKDDSSRFLLQYISE